jgi:glycosidase
MLNLLGSHDTERVLTRHNGVVEDLMLAYALMFTSEGAPMIYYGDEIGMVGQNDPGCRGGMQWDVAEWSQPISEGVRALSEARANTVSLRRGVQEYRAIDSDTVAVIRTIRNERTVAVIHRGNGRILRREEIPLDHQHGTRLIAGRMSTPEGFYEVDKSDVLIVTGTPNGA